MSSRQRSLHVHLDTGSTPRWRADAHLSRAHWRHLHASGRSPAKTTSEPRTAHSKTSCACLCGALVGSPEAAAYSVAMSAIIHLLLHSSRAVWVFALLPWFALHQFPRSRPVGQPHRVLERTSPLPSNTPLVPHHSRRNSSYYTVVPISLASASSLCRTDKVCFPSI
jgi:hypothetical protein